ncbi:Fatty acid cis/trans isomerase (CTI) [Geopseudomonas sagittaria]|uniref:Fatty acid cis/trans isomerase (CTI) n=1 Tax=Geopseudomonas sagittaria TaxID=1135990 RepID=A0A1I5TP69_9GAMM|nr:fatty acid cis/trans isomerase [Pseudomonas sagittaria]SFP84839.1 Fatty acid cis/trans isomerase (CTI) [Pseudomonas sagittaria]
MPIFFLLLASLLVSQPLSAASLSYSRDVQPILTAKCVACHACYDAPCQLNLGSATGIQRGASRVPVYNGKRIEADATTRLFVDAQTEEGWRARGFHSVLGGGDAALVARMLELGRSHAPLPGSKLPEDLDIGIRRETQCPRPEEFADFARKNPRAGMPFAVTGLSDGEYATLRQWLAEGASLDGEPLAANASEAAQIAEWESLLNRPGTSEQLAARWLYEHLFLAHLYFVQGASGHFFELVRSRTPSGEAVDVIATRRPNDDPGTQVFYRLRPIQGVIVHKTHITYPLSRGKLARVEELFFAGDWKAEALPGYGPQRRANPFETFAAIPARARYLFMLDDAEYFVRTFIRGPVCRGQIATDVIRDHFWTLFQAPDHDLYLTDAAYREQVTPLLALPGVQDDLAQLPLYWSASRARRNAYEAARREAYSHLPHPSWSHIWAGNDNALLSIFRQHDSASVRKGLIGAVPQTLWWLDFPLLERTYYQLVVNFDVFGNVSHQAQTRLYFDLIRNGAEQNFLRLMPPAQRQAILGDWYQYSGKLRLWLDYEGIDRHTPSGLRLPADHPKAAFAERLLERYGTLNARPDPLNRCRDGRCFRPAAIPALQRIDQRLSSLAARSLAELPAIEYLPEATLLRVELDGGGREVYSLLRNRAHSNVAFMLGESLRYQPEKDTLTLYPEVLTSYPNFLFSLREGEVNAFVASLQQARNAADFERIVLRWGVRRTHPQFWALFHDLSEHIRETDPVEAGILDMNRYQNL